MRPFSPRRAEALTALLLTREPRPTAAEHAASGRRGMEQLMAETVAVTGATGFVGRALIERLAAAGLRPRALVRRGEVLGTSTVRGDLDDAGALAELVRDAAHVVHLAGVVKAPEPAAFARVNAGGTERLARAMAKGTGRLVLVSSLAARHPEVSAYAGSKRAAEDVALEILGPERVTILRPPAVYGPGDRATLLIFRQLASGFLVAPGPRGARFSLIHVGDLVELIAAYLARQVTLPALIEPDDGHSGGYGWGDLAAVAARATGRRVRTLRVPVRLLDLPARAADGLARRFALDLPLSRDKLGELGHGQWVAGGPALPEPTPRITFEAGFGQTLDWYRRAGWL
jgi:nucleoside-diphosphate-sugar epimerase